MKEGAFGYTWGQVRKALVTLVGFAAVVLSTALTVGPEVIPPAALPWINIFIAVSTVYGVFRVKNEPTGG